jgi:CheY-like chemotaxis protein
MSELPNDVRAKILIAEDDAIVALDLQGMVMRLGYDVVAIVDNGQAAVAAAQRFMPDIILLDIKLNGPLDGIEVAREIHQSHDLPVIFCLSSADLAVLVRAKEISYAGYLLKPINPDSLSTTLDTALYKYKLEKRVEEAEARFRGLTDKCEILKHFFDSQEAFGWEWLPETGLVSLVLPDSFSATASIFGDKINGILASRFSGSPVLAPDTQGDSLFTGERVSGIFEVPSGAGELQKFVLLGARNSRTGKIEGVVMCLGGALQ